MEKFWTQIPYEKSTAETLYQSLNIGFPLCVILAQRGIASKSEAEKFLWPKLAHLDDPAKVKNVDRAVDMLVKIVDNNLRIAIVGDYDVDGITSITLLSNVLKNFDVVVDFFVPRRACEGYGLSREIIDRMLTNKRYDVVIALDCGTNSMEEVKFLQKNGIEVLIIDHHQAKKMPIADCCIVNPHIADDARCKVLCTVGLVFKVSHVLLKVFRRRNDRRALTYSIKNDLDLVALGTIADMSQLIYDNRIFCKFGLKILSGKCRRPGIEALCKSADIPSGTNLCQADVSFKLCPRLNACGRLADAVLPISMMMSNDFDEATTYAYELDETNKERQLIEKEIMEQADRLARKNYMEDSALVLYDKTWHSGVVGIVSSKLAKDYARPCIVLGSERNMARGSGRSTNNVNLIDAMCECSEYLETWGGHPYAVGVSMPAANVDAFRRAFNEVIARQSAGTSKRCEMEYSLELLLEEINGGLTKELEMLQPFGQKNQEPVFLLKNVKINDLPETFGSQKSHIKFWLIDKYSKRMLVIGWNCAANIPPIGIPLDLLITANYETWNRIRSTRLTMIDWAISRTE